MGQGWRHRCTWGASLAFLLAASPAPTLEATVDESSLPTELIGGDPRLNDECRHFFARHENYSIDLSTPSHPLDMTVIEDLAAGVDLIPRAADLVFQPYGRILPARLADSGKQHQGIKRRPLVAYVEIPKAGSTSFKTAAGLMMHLTPLAAAKARATLTRWKRRNDPMPAFAIVREPLERAISAYGTVRKRFIQAGCGGGHVAPSAGGRLPRFACPPWLYERNATAAFSMYVRHLTSGKLVHNTALFGRHVKPLVPGYNVALPMHAFSQSFFLALFRWPISRVARLEHLPEHMQQIERAHGKLLRPRGKPIVIAARKAGKRNVNEGGETVYEAVERVPDELLLRLARHYRQDYACLGYPYPPRLLRHSQRGRSA